MCCEGKAQLVQDRKRWSEKRTGETPSLDGSRRKVKRGEIGTQNEKLPRSLIQQGWRILAGNKGATMRMPPPLHHQLNHEGNRTLVPPVRTLLRRSPGGKIITIAQEVI
ncbi:hypothetical protein TNCT_494461 [Trichonephila clavata]|uniref:Uncharacterized protein n=1 Tax=Trichonephila clavata TaxID=2740835 RepID=A0A8X6KLR7_TRICU|nr:hypothetical protein TNCT_494461 [Trichonephila clavata]